jgi:hypothetical protein
MEGWGVLEKVWCGEREVAWMDIVGGGSGGGLGLVGFVEAVEAVVERGGGVEGSMR